MISAQKKARLLWQCRRGMLELDLLLTRFMARNFEALSDEQITALESLLSYSDPELYAFLMGQSQPVNKEIADVVAFIRLQNHPEAVK